MDIINANYFEVKLEDNTVVYMEEQEHCDILWEAPEHGVAGRYIFNTDRNKIRFHKYETDIWVFGDILKYSFDYGKTLIEVNT